MTISSPAAVVPVDLRAAREALGLTRARLAAQVGVTQGLLSRWECGYTLVPAQWRAELADALGVDPVRLEQRSVSPVRARTQARRRPVVAPGSGLFTPSPRVVTPGAVVGAVDRCGLPLAEAAALLGVPVQRCVVLLAAGRIRHRRGGAR